MLLLTGCASFGGGRLEAPSSGSSSGASAARTTSSTHEHDLVAALETWRATPHRWGGTTPGGADCSGFVYSLFRDAFDVDLPRTTDRQVRVGAEVTPESLTTGDLVFFRPKGQQNHVGVYLGEGTFAHISSSQGFMHSRLDEPYWRRYYWTARRVLPYGRELPSVAVAPVAETDRRISTSSRRRGGW
ncbi:MAG: C40 family peptidase [Bacteroidota bacterium]